MAENIAIEVKFQGETQIYSPSSRTSWEDLYAMLQCSFEVDDIAVFYVDDEDEEVAIDSQEEYDEAKDLSLKCSTVLQLRVYFRDQRPVEPHAVETPPPPKELVEAAERKQATPPKASCEGTDRSSCSPKVSSSTEPIPIPPPRPSVPPRLNRTQSVSSCQQDQAQGGVAGRVRRAVEELKQMDTSALECGLEESPGKEKILIDRIVKGVLDGLEPSVQERSRPHSWDPSQDTRVSVCSPSGQDSARPKTRSPGQGPVIEHTGITCNNCNKTIAGVRFKCGHCMAFDLCEECEQLSGCHDPNHVFLKLKRPAFRLGLKSDGRMAPIFKHPVYADDDTPVWEYKIKKLEEKMARKAARAELKRKYREEKRRVKIECHGQVSPTKRERIEAMAEQQAEQIMSTVNMNVLSTSFANAVMLAETTPLLVRKFDACFIRDGNLPDETHLQPRTKFVKSWILKNTGNVQWNQDTKLKLLWGNIKTLSQDPVDIPPLTPGEEGPICVDFEAPANPGNYQSHWRLVQRSEQFGHRVWCNIIVDKAEVLEPTCEKKKTVKEEIVLHMVQVQESAPVQIPDTGENTPSSAVAHLQTDQSNGEQPSRVLSSSDLLTAQDVLSFELLNIRDDQEADKEVEGVNSPAATTTPNNTPIVGLTPCISPIPQLDEKLLCRRVSEHSDLEIVRREDIPEIVETQVTMSHDAVSRNAPLNPSIQDGVEMAAVYSENEDAVESIDSSSDNDILDDYCVVPLPDCFDPSKPIDKSMILSRSSLSSSMTSSVTNRSSSESSSIVRLPSYEESQAENPSFPTSPEVAVCPTGGDISKEIASIIADEEFGQLSFEMGKEEEKKMNSSIAEASKELEPTPMEEKGEIKPTLVEMQEELIPQVTPVEGARSHVDHTVDSLLGTLTNPALDTTPLIPLVAASPLQQQEEEEEQSSTSPPAKSTSPVPQAVAVAPMPQITLLATPAAATSTSHGGVLINPEGSVLYQTAAKPGVDQQTNASAMRSSDGTNIDTAPQSQEITSPERERVDDHDDEFHDAQDDATTAGQSPVPVSGQVPISGIQYQTQTDPVDLLGYTAARAVEVAGSVVRQAFDTAASSVGALLRPQPIPMPAPYEPTVPTVPPTQLAGSPSPSPTPTPAPASASSSMDQLIEMGFANRVRNQALLDKHNGDVSRCVQDLLHEGDNDWPNNRH